MVILNGVKKALGITGDYQDETIATYIAEVQGYMIDAGVPEAVASSEKAIGVIARGVSDLWNYNEGKLSEYFYQRVGQLAIVEDE